jgi:hypothetical protein
MKTYTVKFKQAAVMMGIALSSVGVGGMMTPANALRFDFIPAPNTSQSAIDGFTAAGVRWSSLFNDPVKITIDINFIALDPGILAQASSNRQMYSYSDVSTALRNDLTSTDDRTAVANLPNGTVTSFDTLINRTKNNPYGAGDARSYLDISGANTSMLNISSANAKALGLPSGMSTIGSRNIATIQGSIPTTTINTSPTNSTVGADASIAFSTMFNFDFDPSNGIDSDKYDFIGVAMHEIGHALGFTSGVDILDINSPLPGSSPPAPGPFNDDQFTFVNTLDLFRYSAASKAEGAIDWTADARAKYFSLDRGATSIAAFATGGVFGDGQQASHWKDSSNYTITPELGIMNPTFSAGQLGIITENDLRAFDVIGWDRASATATAVPEPADFIGTAIGAIFGVKLIQKRRQQRAKSALKVS